MEIVAVPSITPYEVLLAVTKMKSGRRSSNELYITERGGEGNTEVLYLRRVRRLLGLGMKFFSKTYIGPPLNPIPNIPSVVGVLQRDCAFGHACTFTLFLRFFFKRGITCNLHCMP